MSPEYWQYERYYLVFKRNQTILSSTSFKNIPLKQNTMASLSEFTAVLKEKRYLTPEVMLLSFQVPDTFTFQAGQYVMIKIEREATWRLKSYSILNPPVEKGKLDLCVSIIPGGFASEAFKVMESGQEYTFRGPLGRFEFDTQTTNPEHWFICTGTGITPLYSMIKEYLQQYPQQKFVLLFGEKTTSEFLFYDEFRQLEQQHSNFRYHPLVSRESWAGKQGRVQEHLPADVQDKTFYICGLKEMVLETKELLEQQGVRKENIKVERYT